MRAGVSEGIITPSYPTLMAGYPLPKDRFHTGVHDDLAIRCFYFENKNVELGIISFDICEISKKRVGYIREAIEKACNIPQNNIAVCCTHTHSGPVTTNPPHAQWTEDRELYPQYLDYLVEIAAAKMAEAKEKSFPAEAAIGKGICGSEQNVGGNRHEKNGPADPEVCCLAIYENKSMRGALINYALHPTFLHADNTELSADYPCYIYQHLRNRYPGVVVGFTMGATGNQSSRFFRSGQNFDEAKRVGMAISTEAMKVMEQSPKLKDPALFAEVYDFMPPMFENLPLDEAKAAADLAKRNYEKAKADGRPYPFVRGLECTLIGANHVLEIAKGGDAAKRIIQSAVPFEVQIMGIGDARYVFYSCEVFVEYGLLLKQKSPYPLTFLSTVSNGTSCGYVCTPKAHQEGGYEALWTRYSPETGEQLVDFTLSKLKRRKHNEQF